MSEVVDLKTRTEAGLRLQSAAIQPFMDDPDCIEIMLNADGSVWIDVLGSGMSKTDVTIKALEAKSILNRVASSLGLTLTVETPIVEGELVTDGSRIEGLIPPVVDAPIFAIRKKASKVFTLDDYLAAGIINDEFLNEKFGQEEVAEEAVLTGTARDILGRLCADRQNILVVGSTSSGKTTFCNALLYEIGQATPEHRVVIIEDTRELQCPVVNRLELRTLRIAGRDIVTMQHLLKATLRLRPDRIVVGEVRDRAALDLLKAWNTGHPGGVATVHANNAKAGLKRIEQLVAEDVGGRVDPEFIAEAVNVIVFISKTKKRHENDPGRLVKEIVRVKGWTRERGYVLEPIGGVKPVFNV